MKLCCLLLLAVGACAATRVTWDGRGQNNAGTRISADLVRGTIEWVHDAPGSGTGRIVERGTSAIDPRALPKLRQFADWVFIHGFSGRSCKGISEPDLTAHITRYGVTRDFPRPYGCYAGEDARELLFPLLICVSDFGANFPYCSGILQDAGLSSLRGDSGGAAGSSGQ